MTELTSKAVFIALAAAGLPEPVSADILQDRIVLTFRGHVDATFTSAKALEDAGLNFIDPTPGEFGLRTEIDVRRSGETITRAIIPLFTRAAYEAEIAALPGIEVDVDDDGTLRPISSAV